ncbi:hypothetical protein GCM10011517_22780 [Actibacterium pelagium]|uniref:Uncharacterized protein n=1 Tax=Actibacterium pelagium TaxID=2029103 RepID=A0A917AHX6_9RHOB|nr:hypothetical protein GCM10011517_22780 [Actibacterium pelagium]
MQGPHPAPQARDPTRLVTAAHPGVIPIKPHRAEFPHPERPTIPSGPRLGKENGTSLRNQANQGDQSRQDHANRRDQDQQRQVLCALAHTQATTD